MPSPRSSSAKGAHSGVVGAGAAGGGVGTAISLYAQSLPVSSPYKVPLSVFAPLLGIGVSGIWLFIKSVYIDPIAARKQHEARQKLGKLLVADARELYERVKNDPNSTVKHRDSVRMNLEKLELSLVEGSLERLLG
jgi:hypothetical protein